MLTKAIPVCSCVVHRTQYDWLSQLSFFLLAHFTKEQVSLMAVTHTQETCTRDHARKT